MQPRDWYLIGGAIVLGTVLFLVLLIAIPRARVSRPELLRPLPPLRRTGVRPGMRVEEPLEARPPRPRPYVPELADLQAPPPGEDTTTLPRAVAWERDIP